MSGGVDSSVVAALLAAEGHEVVGATLKLWGGDSDSGCCSISDVSDARRVADQIGIPHHVFNYTDEFNAHVVTPYVAGIAAGRTPNPCIECNRTIKFDALLTRAARLGFDRVATGHHANIVARNGQPRLARSVDPLKDQSYVLGYLRGPQLEQLLLPLGEMTKTEVRTLATRFGLRTAAKPDSQDVCFIEASKGREAFFAPRIPLTPARVVDRVTGEEVGTLPAAQLVTVGQRRGLAPGRDGERRYVAHVDVTTGIVEVDRLEGVVTSTLHLDPHSLTYAYDAIPDGTAVTVQVSAHGRPLPATWFGAASRVELDSPHRPVAAGQSVVAYDGAIVLGAAVVA
jgi:tRNA-uridine 2-sulfurtransferase